LNYETILVEKKEHVGIITLNRPENLNTFNAVLATELVNALENMEKDEDVRVVVIKGNGRAFCAGIDVTELEGKTPLELYDWHEWMGKAGLVISKMRKPVIVSTHKICVANGVGIVASADLAITSDDTKFGLTAVNVGLFCIGPAVPVIRNLGRKKALELLLTGKLISAEEALNIGLVNQVVPRDKLEEETMKLAEEIAAKSPLAVQLGKMSFYKMADLEYEKALEVTNNHFVLLCTTEDSKEGVDAFFNKRKPEWKLK